MNILITGINGCIGRTLAKRLKEAGNTIVGIGKQERCNNADVYYQLRLGSEGTENRLCFAIPNIDAVVHLAANLSMDFMEKDIISDNIIALQQILSLIKHHKCNCIVYMSSVGVYGFPENIPVTESHLIHCKTLYHLTKFFGEEMLRLFCQYNPWVKHIILRMAAPVGVGMREKTFLSTILLRAKRGETITLYGNGGRVQNYIDVRDVCRAVGMALTCDIKGTFNLGGRSSYSNLRVAELCRDLTRGKSDIRFFGEDIHENERWIIDIEKIAKELGFRPKYELKDTIQWMLAENES